jgi:hypothetical protein
MPWRREVLEFRLVSIVEHSAMRSAKRKPADERGVWR